MMTPTEIDDLGVSCDVPTAARALGIGKTSAYTAIREGTFPVPVLRVGARYVVPTAGLKAALGLVPAIPRDAA